MIGTLAETMKIKSPFWMVFFWFKDVHYIIQSYFTVCSKTGEYEQNATAMEGSRM